jgi:arsenate reductase
MTRKRPAGKRSVLFICTHNAARSQMAEAFTRSLLGDRWEAASAGASPTAVNPLVVRAMAELGVDISGARSKSVEEFRGRSFDAVATLCDRARESCPFFPASGERIHMGFDDPSALRGSEEDLLRELRRIRDEIRSWVLERFGGEGGERPGRLGR